MKSVERHKLETNWLATHLDQWVEKIRPYASTIIGVLVAILVIVFGWSFFSGESSKRETEAWNAFNVVVGGPMNEQSITQLGKSAEEFTGTDMQPWAKVTWADGEVWTATQSILQNRAAAMSALEQAASAYMGIIGSSSDETLIDRSRFGLARIYELRNEPDKARDEYLKVQGSFAALAKQRATALAEEKTKQTLDWLAKAEVTRAPAPRGPGIPGQRPPLDVEDIALPGSTGAADPTKTEFNIEELFKDIGELGKDADKDKSSERYPAGDAAKQGDASKEGDAKKEGDATNKGGERTTPGDAKPATKEAPKGGSS